MHWKELFAADYLSILHAKDIQIESSVLFSKVKFEKYLWKYIATFNCFVINA